MVILLVAILSQISDDKQQQEEGLGFSIEQKMNDDLRFILNVQPSWRRFKVISHLSSLKSPITSSREEDEVDDLL